MRKIMRINAHVWTACAAGWMVIGIVTNVMSAYVAGLGCMGVAVLCLAVAGDK